MCRSHSRPFWEDWLMSSANMDEEGKFCIRCPNRRERLKLFVKAVKLSQLSRCSWQFEATALLWCEETAGCLKLDWLAIHNGTSIFVQGRWLNSVLNINTKSCNLVKRWVSFKKTINMLHKLSFFCKLCLGIHCLILMAELSQKNYFAS